MSDDVAMQDATSEEETQRLVDIVNNDSDVKESRAARTPVLKPGDLTTQEKMALIDLVILFASLQEPEPTQGEEAQTYHAFLHKVFTRWKSDKEENEPPLLDTREFPNVSVQAGVLDEDYIEHHQADHRGARLAGAPVFLDFFLRPETDICMEWINDEPWHDEIFGGEARPLENGWGFLWRDKNGQPVSRGDVTLTDDFDNITDAKVAVILKYDQDKLLRVAKYNHELVITAARRRIRKWASDGTESTPRVDEDDLVDAVDVDYETTLASDCAEDWFKRAERLVTRLRAASS
ncbi:hypothetical protein CEP54_006027 [Fusarium duplospermum]|uniref:Uncharacterized protein n=1 Tax=Fusarium duplospermum TaxID=1325734 RepID=A0A428Q9D3_9HYPO|nr:hypothetical protein CEP54_006027 [Fusarium duplospermum]